MEHSRVSDDPISVLYVDDEPSLLELGKMYLERADGISVTTAGTPEEAIPMIKDGGFDAIVSDYQMPGMDGIAFLKYIRRTHDEMPFLLYTGKGREDIVIEALNNGADYYVEKVKDPELQFTDLVHKIRLAVSRDRTEQVLRDTYDKLHSSTEQLALYSEELNIREERIIEIEEALLESEQLYETIFANTGSATAIIDEDMTIALANDAFADLAGYSRREIEGRIKWQQFVHPDDRERLERYHWARRCRPGSAPQHYEFRFVDRSGTERVIYMTIGLIPGTYRSVASHTDITELREARDRLSLFGNILDESQNEIYLFRADTLRFVQANRGGQENLGYTMDELLNLTPVDLKPEYTEASFREMIAPLLSGEAEIIRFTTIHRRKDGSEYPVEVHLHLSQVVTPPVFVGIIFDITERLRAEEENRILRHMVDHASCAITIHDFEGRFIYANERTLAMHGYTRDEFMALPLRDLDVPASAAQIEDRFREVREEGEAIFEAEHYRKDGTTLPVLVHLTVAEWGERTVLLSIAEDITGWRVIETALRESRNQLSFALEAANEGLWDWNIPKNEAYFSPRYLQMLGYTAEAFAQTYEAWWEYVHPDDRADLESSIREAVATRGDFHREFRMRRTDGSYLWILARGRVMETDDAGHPVRMVGTHTDISVRKRVEEALRESRDQLEYALDAANECLWEWNMVTGAAAMTRQYPRMLGYAPGEFPDTHAAWWEYMHPDDREGVQAAIDKAVAAKSAYSHEFRMRKKDGSYLWVLARGRVTEWDDAGRPVRMSGTHIDISDRKEIEEALLESRKQLEFAFDAANEGLWDLNLVSHAAFVSTPYVRMLGYAPGEFPTDYTVWGRFVHPKDRMGLESAVCEAIATQEPLSEEFRMQKKDGSYLWVLARGRVMEWDDEGRPIRMVGTNTDISVRKQAEEALRLANRKLHLLSGITRHDILNQAMALNGYLLLALEQNTDRVLNEYLQKMQRAAVSVERTIAFTREYEQLGQNDPKWISLRQAAGDVRYCTDLAVTFSCEGIAVFADPLLEKVFFNLMDNVLRHGQNATAVSISCVSGEDGGLTIVWEDNGEGVADGDKERIFDRKYGKNTGMGLFLAREILSITGIAIRESGNEGEGARFELAVPPGAWKRMDTNEHPPDVALNSAEKR